MKKLFYSILFTAAALSLWRCKDYVALEYQNAPRLYFYNVDVAGLINGQRDSISYSFFVQEEGVRRDTVYIDVRTMGDTVGYDRPIVLTQTNIGKPNAAVAGQHFIGFDQPGVKEKMVIPAGRVAVNVPLIVTWQPDLKTSVVRLELEVAGNEYFEKGIDKYSTFLVTITAAPVEPTGWYANFRYVFGTWGAEKMTFIMKYLGFRDFDQAIADMSYRTYLNTKATSKLAEYNANPLNNPPLKEADGTLVTF